MLRALGLPIVVLRDPPLRLFGDDKVRLERGQRAHEAQAHHGDDDSHPADVLRQQADDWAFDDGADAADAVDEAGDAGALAAAATELLACFESVKLAVKLSPVFYLWSW